MISKMKEAIYLVQVAGQEFDYACDYAKNVLGADEIQRMLYIQSITFGIVTNFKSDSRENQLAVDRYLKARSKYNTATSNLVSLRKAAGVTKAELSERFA